MSAPEEDASASGRDERSEAAGNGRAVDAATFLVASSAAGEAEATSSQRHVGLLDEGDDPRGMKRKPDVDEEARDASAKVVKRLPDTCSRAGLPVETDLGSFRVPNRSSPPMRADDKDGHYRYESGENFTSRYKILSKMGEGVRAGAGVLGQETPEYVAIKIVRNVPKYRDAAMIELEVLNTLKRNDPDGHWHCVTLLEWFTYRGHVCMAFEKLGPSLFDFLRKNRYKPFPMDYVQSFSLQLIEAVAYLHRLALVHTDLKPENILLATAGYQKISNNPRVGKRIPETDRLRLIDFGSATFEEQYHSTIVSTRHYRAPEVILGLGWSYPCDMWSIGCIIVELITGDALFQTHENMEHLAMMEAVLGRIPEKMALRASRHSSKYIYKNRLDWPGRASSSESIRAVEKMVSLKEVIGDSGDLKFFPALQGPLLDLLSGLLQYEPENRMTAEEALQHSFFSQTAKETVMQARLQRTTAVASAE
eukprot:CAMPEP_0117660242 /NCGR_PEP_ID=MMETSP0804-20121206/6866_1 /TAXON_ID=1074897 /ORGANISM="Tetraselmis astigmatica, Strain CCMP880" /LENGTH=478 /DNA_ID=CAMNT_0005466963 /DNA_START=271 /DNA_END=1708 /DNA_ORIENTATION=-